MSKSSPLTSADMHDVWAYCRDVAKPASPSDAYNLDKSKNDWGGQHVRPYRPGYVEPWPRPRPDTEETARRRRFLEFAKTFRHVARKAPQSEPEPEAWPKIHKYPPT